MDDQELRRLERLVYVDLKDHIDAVLAQRDKRIEDKFSATERAVLVAVNSQEMRVAEVSRQLEHRLNALNELRAQSDDRDRLFATRDSVEQSVAELRLAIDNASAERSRELVAIRTQQDEGKGRRAAFQVSVAIIVTLISVALGLMWKNQPTRAEITQQIREDAPWTEDKPEVLQRITLVETRQQGMLVRLEAIDVLNRFFCKTRQPTLPGC